MKRLLYAVLLGFPMAFSAQSAFSNELKLLLQKPGLIHSPINILVKGDIRRLRAHEQTGSISIFSAGGNIAAISCDVGQLQRMVTEGCISNAEMPGHSRKLLMDTAIYRNRLQGVQKWTAPLPRSYSGKGVVIGFVDSGIDFRHPDFLDSSGKTRVLYLWDQPSNGNAPTGYNYGTEWTAAQISGNLCSHSDLVYGGHGTQVAGVAAGNGRATGHFSGVAPEADIIMVAGDFARPSAVADGVNYIFSRAAALGKPCVVNLSLGEYLGSHDGTDLETQLLESMVTAAPGRVIVGAAGNAGNYRMHVRSKPSGDTVFTWLTGTGPWEYRCYADSADASRFFTRVGATRVSFSDAAASPFSGMNRGSQVPVVDTVKNISGARIGLVRTSSYVNSRGTFERYYEISPDSAGMLWRIETAGKGTHDAWGFDFRSAGLPVPTQYPRIVKYVSPDTMYSLVSGFQCSEEIITVGNYVNLSRYYDMNDSLVLANQPGGAIAYNSSSGPTRDGRTKPDVTATGDYVFTTLPLQLLSGFRTTNPEIVARDSMHILTGGTSASAPVVAGLAALYLQKNPAATNREIRNAVRFCAYTDVFTTGNVPNYAWGYGKLDGKAAMLCNEPVVMGYPHDSNSVAIHPVPSTGMVTFNFETEGVRTISLFMADGRMVRKELSYGSEHTMDLSGFHGVFIGRTEGDGTSTFRLIIE